jgi:competence protein ComEA
LPGWLERHKYVLLVAALLLLAGGVLLRDFTDSTPPTFTITDSQGSEDGTVVVHVAGAVAAPGVYQLQAGARIQDGVLAAGGGLADADLDALNLARRLRDGERVSVPASTGATTEVAATLVPGQTLDINRATQAQLDALPGIGEAYSRRIVDSRRVDGPYTSLDDLVWRRVLPPATLASVRDYLSVAP